MQTIRVLIADVQRLFSGALARALAAWPDLDVVDARPATAPDVLRAVEEHEPDVVVLDLWLPDLEAPALTAMLLERRPEVAVVAVSGFFSPDHISGVLHAGAAAFVPKTIEVETLVGTIRRAHAGERPVDVEALDRLIRTLAARTEAHRDAWERLSRLSPREVEILAALNVGHANDEIAEELGIARKTVANHIQAILDKTATHSRSEAVNMARNVAFVTPLPYRWKIIQREHE